VSDFVCLCRHGGVGRGGFHKTTETDRKLPSAYVCIRQQTLPSAYVCIRQQPAVCVSIRQHTSEYVSRCPHTSAYVSIRQHTSAYDVEAWTPRCLCCGSTCSRKAVEKQW
jgi:hypothetical protein